MRLSGTYIVACLCVPSFCECLPGWIRPLSRSCWLNERPVFIGFPADLCHNIPANGSWLGRTHLGKLLPVFEPRRWPFMRCHVCRNSSNGLIYSDILSFLVVQAFRYGQCCPFLISSCSYFRICSPLIFDTPINQGYLGAVRILSFYSISSDVSGPSSELVTKKWYGEERL